MSRRRHRKSDGESLVKGVGGLILIWVISLYWAREHTTFALLATVLSLLIGVMAIGGLGWAGLAISRRLMRVSALEPSMPASSRVAAFPVAGTRAQASVEYPGFTSSTLERLEWHGWERLVLLWCQAQGMTARLTPFGPDDAVDVEVTAPQPLSIQVKAYQKPVGVRVVRELIGVETVRRTHCAIVSKSGFTADARRLAAEVDMQLVDGEEVRGFFTSLPSAEQERLAAQLFVSGWDIPSCPSCGTKLVKRESKRGSFWGCTHYPRCRGTIPG